MRWFLFVIEKKKKEKKEIFLTVQLPKFRKSGLGHLKTTRPVKARSKLDNGYPPISKPNKNKPPPKPSGAFGSILQCILWSCSLVPRSWCFRNFPTTAVFGCERFGAPRPRGISTSPLMSPRNDVVWWYLGLLPWHFGFVMRSRVGQLLFYADKPASLHWSQELNCTMVSWGIPLTKYTGGGFAKNWLLQLGKVEVGSLLSWLLFLEILRSKQLAQVVCDTQL